MSTTTTPARRQTYGAVRTPRPSIGIGARSQDAPAPPAMPPAVPFDWAAARGLKGIPYATPENRRLRQLAGTTNSATPTTRSTPGRKSLNAPHIRSVGIIERIQSWPSEIMFQLALFPHNVPLPRARTSARVLAGLAHVLHLCVRYSATGHMSDDELGWEEMLSEADAAIAVFTWNRVLNYTLVFVALANAAYFASRTREYTHFCASEPLNTPHARFVRADEILSKADDSGPSTLSRIANALWTLTKAGWRWVFGIAAPPAIEAIIDGRVVQKVDMWMPEEFEKTFFTIYSPVHAVLWMFWTPLTWLSYSFAMAILGVQLSILMTAYDGLIKDTRILQASVMAEYDLNFVQPRLNIIKRDACVQTSEAEMLFVRKERDVPRHRRRYTDFSS